MDLIATEVDQRRAAGESVEPREYHDRFPQQAAEVEAAFELLRRPPRAEASVADTESLAQQSLSDTADAQRQAAEAAEPIPETIGRYRVQKRLGTGGYGAVYLAQDPDLDRLVALKVPRPDRFTSEDDRERFIGEAKTAAKLEHAGIVTIYDVFRDGERVVIVQKYIQGQDLREYLQSGAITPERAAGLMAAIAEALAFSHSQALPGVRGT